MRGGGREPGKSLAECTQPPIPHPQIGLRRPRGLLGKLNEAT